MHVDFCVLDNPRLLYEIMAMIPPLLASLFLPCVRVIVTISPSGLG